MTCGAAYLARRGAAPSRPSRLHVTNGESAGNTLRQTALGGAVLSWQDTLHEGPVPASPRREPLRVDALREDRQVVLWFEHDLYDQLQLLDVLALAHAEERARAHRDRLIPRSAVLRRLGRAGGARARDALALAPAGDTGGAAQRRARGPPSARRSRPGWPSGRRAKPPTCRFSRPRCGGCSRSCRRRRTACRRPSARALDVPAGGARTPPAAFVAAQRREAAPFLGDTWFYRAVSALGQGETRLLETDAGAPLAPPPL